MQKHQRHKCQRPQDSNVTFSKVVCELVLKTIPEEESNLPWVPAGF